MTSPEREIIVGVDGRIISTHFHRGSSRHLMNLMSQLEGFKIKVFSNQEMNLPASLDARVEKIIAGPSSYALWEQFYLPFALARAGVHVLISPNHTAPLLTHAKRVPIVHDFIFNTNIRLARALSKTWFASIYRSGLTLYAAKRAALIITVSDSTRKLILAAVGSAKPICVATNVLPSKFEAVGTHPTAVRTHALMVSGIQPHKNVERALRAFAEATKSEDMPLDIVGINSAQGEPTIARAGVGEHLSNRISWLTNLTEDSLVQCYRRARIFIFPSIDEGFGIPLLEAMANDVVIICSDIPVFREICGESAIYFNPTSHESIVAAISKGLALDAPPSSYSSQLQRYTTSQLEVQARQIEKEINALCR